MCVKIFLGNLLGCHLNLVTTLTNLTAPSGYSVGDNLDNIYGYLARPRSLLLIAPYRILPVSDSGPDSDSESGVSDIEMTVDSVVSDETFLDGPIKISIGLALYPLDSEALYAKELAIVRFLSWLVSLR